MTSSTSNSNSRPLVRLVLCLLVVFAALEVFTRTVLFHTSKDFVRFATYAGRADSLTNQPGLRIALVGNSATEEGVDPALFKTVLGHNVAKPVSVDLFLADGSEIQTWRIMINHYFWRRSDKPDVIILNFFGSNLQDSDQVEWGRVAQCFTEVSEWSDLSRVDLKNGTSRLEFFTSSIWATYAARNRIKQRVLTLVIPEFQRYDQLINELIRRYAAPASEAVKTTPSYQALTELLERANSEQVKVILVAFPTRSSRYIIDPRILEIANINGAQFLDMRQYVSIEPVDYRDDIHLNANGRQLYTRYLGRALSQLLQPTIQAAGSNVTTPTGKKHSSQRSDHR